jgi:hypothetical protein
VAARTQTRTPGSRLVRRTTLLVDLDTLAREAGMHPALVRRFMELGLIDQRGGTSTDPLFAREAAALLARAYRIRRDLGVGYAGAVLACELLARIDDLEARLARRNPTR